MRTYFELMFFNEEDFNRILKTATALGYPCEKTKHQLIVHGLDGNKVDKHGKKIEIIAFCELAGI